MDIKGAYQEARRSSNGGKGREEASRGASLRSGGEDDVASYVGTYYMEGGAEEEEKGIMERGRRGPRKRRRYQPRGSGSRGTRAEETRRRVDDDDAILSPLHKRLSPQLSPQPSLSPIPRLFAMAGLLSVRPDRRVNASGVAGAASSFPTTPGDVTSRSPANKARQGRGRRGGAPRAAAFCPERGSAIASRRGVPVPGPVGVRLVPRGRSPAPRSGGGRMERKGAESIKLLIYIKF